MENATKDRRRCAALERHPAGGHLVEHCAEAEQVGTGVQFFSACLFRGHIRDCSHRNAWTGEGTLRGTGGGHATYGTAFRHELSESEIQDLRLVTLGHKDVGGFNVSMDDPFLVRRV